MSFDSLGHWSRSDPPLTVAAKALVGALTLMGAGLVGCGSDSSSTAGERIVLHVAVVADPATKSMFTTGFGWDVTLSQAAVATGGLYFFDGPPPTARLRLPAPSLQDRIESLFIKTAWAHPGHYQAGTALGQVLLPQPVALDLFGAQPVHLPDGDGVTGIYRSARFVIPTVAPADAPLTGHVALIEGTAVKHDGTTPAPIYFRLIADYADVAAYVNNGAVDGCVLDEVTVTDSGTITMEIRPAVWLNLVDFSKIDPGGEGAPTEARSAGFSQGVTQLSAYHFAYAP